MKYFFILITLLLAHSYFKGEEIRTFGKGEDISTKSKYHNVTLGSKNSIQETIDIKKLEDQEIIHLEKELSTSANDIPQPLREIANEPNFKEITSPTNNDFLETEIASDHEAANTSSLIILKLKNCLLSFSCEFIQVTAIKDSRFDPNDTPSHRQLNNALTALLVSLDRDEELEVTDYISLDQLIPIMKINNPQTRLLAAELIISFSDFSESNLNEILTICKSIDVSQKNNLFLTLSSSHVIKSEKLRKMIIKSLTRSIIKGAPADVRILTEDLGLLTDGEFTKMTPRICNKQKGTKAYQETLGNLISQAEGRGLKLNGCI